MSRKSKKVLSVIIGLSMIAGTLSPSDGMRMVQAATSQESLGQEQEVTSLKETDLDNKAEANSRVTAGSQTAAGTKEAAKTAERSTEHTATVNEDGQLYFDDNEEGTFSFSKSEQEIVLEQYVGSAVEVVIPAMALLEGEEYAIEVKEQENYSEGLFYCKEFVEKISFEAVDGKKVGVYEYDENSDISLAGMFYACSILTALDLSGLDTSKVIDMVYMFGGCSGLTALDLSGLDTSNVTEMSSMFSGCSGLTALELSGLDTSNVTEMSSMFSGCSGLTALELSELDTSNVTDMHGMFGGCSGLTTLELSGLDTSNVTDMYYMFCGCEKLEQIITPQKMNETSNIELPGTFYDATGKSYTYIDKDTPTATLLYRDMTLTTTMVPTPTGSTTPSSITSESPIPVESTTPSSITSESPVPVESAIPQNSVVPAPAESTTPSPQTSAVPSPAESTVPSPQTSAAPVSTESPSPSSTVSDGSNLPAEYQFIASGAAGKTLEYVGTANRDITTVEIPATVTVDGTKYKVTSVAAHAFSGCTKLKSVKIGGNVTSIGKKAFYNCKSLTKVVIPAKVTKIGKQAFANCKKLKSITIKTTKLTTKSVGAKAFYGIFKKAVIKTPKSKTKAYKKLLRKKGVSVKATIK